MSRDFWYGRRVLVTGANGFLATHLTNALIKQNAIVQLARRARRTQGNSSIEHDP
jgi:CDP-glucose 4,6-dehydratase